MRARFDQKELPQFFRVGSPQTSEQTIELNLNQHCSVDVNEDLVSSLDKRYHLVRFLSRQSHLAAEH